MTANTHYITVSGLTIEVVRKNIKNLHLGVYPPEGRIRIAVPLAVSDEAVRLAIIGKLGWIRRQQARFIAQPRQSQREMVSGESHYYLGQRYRLHVAEREGPAKVMLCGTTLLVLQVPPKTSTTQREQVLHGWYRAQLRALIPPLLDKWQPVMGVQVAEWGIKRMKTRWGSCNITARRLWFNLELAKKPLPCLEYVVIHELTHLLERRHNDRFKALMDRFMPQWRLHREELNWAPLGYERWDY
jgi:predicted metal-dependent hydrolase